MWRRTSLRAGAANQRDAAAPAPAPIHCRAPRSARHDDLACAARATLAPRAAPRIPSRNRSRYRRRFRFRHRSTPVPVRIEPPIRAKLQPIRSWGSQPNSRVQTRRYSASTEPPRAAHAELPERRNADGANRSHRISRAIGTRCASRGDGPSSGNCLAPATFAERATRKIRTATASVDRYRPKARRIKIQRVEWRTDQRQRQQRRAGKNCLRKPRTGDG